MDGAASLTLTLTLSSADEVAVKADSGLGSSVSKTFLSFAAGGVADTTGNLLVEVPGTGATQASLHTADLLPAVLESFVLDLAARQLQMTFSDVIDVSTYSSTSLTVQNAVSADGDASKSYQLSGGVISSGDTKFVTVDLAVADFVALGENGLLGTEVNNTFISMLASAFDDTSGRDASAVTNGRAVQAKVVVPDVTPPTLVSSTLELSSDKLVLSFSEPLNYSSFESTVISLQSQANRTAGGESRAISSSIATRNADRNIFSVLLEADDLNAIKLADSLAVSSTSTFIAFSSALAVDLGGVAPVGVSTAQAGSVTTLVPDSVSPTLSSFGIDLDDGLLNLTFSEAVRANTIVITHLTLQNAVTAGVSHTLTGGSLTVAQNSVSLQVKMTVSDLNALKAALLASSTSDTYLRFAGGMIADMNGNNVTAVTDGNAVQASSYGKDLTVPSLVSFGLNMNSGVLTLDFSESMSPSSVVTTDFTLQSTGNGSDASAVSFPLTGGNVTTSVVSLTLAIVLLETDLNNIKALAVLAVGTTTTFVSMNVGGAKDVSGNNVTAVGSESGLVSTSFIQDTTRPALLSFTLSIDTGVMVLSFSETVNGSSFDPTELKLQSAANGTAAGVSALTLTGGINATSAKSEMTSRSICHT